MSYNVTVYTHREDGAPMIEVLRSNGSSEIFSTTNSAGETKAFDGRITFYAIIPDGYKFKQWVYRIVNLSSTAQHNTSQTFEYDLGYDLFIWAEIEEDSGGGGGGGEESDEWECIAGSDMVNISTEQVDSIYLDKRTVYRIKIEPEYSGELMAYAEGNGDTVGYLTDSIWWDTDTGIPEDILEENDDGDDGLNFFLTYNVEAGETYYLWVKFYNGNYDGDVDIVVIPPAKMGANDGGTFYVYDKDDGWLECTPLIYADGKWNPVTIVVFGSDG